MSAGSLAVGSPVARGPLWQRLLRTPAEGWSSLVLLGVMLLTVGLAIDDSRWAGNTPGGGSQTSFIPAALLLAGLTGFVLARLRISTLPAHLVTSLVGAGFLLITFGTDARSVRLLLTHPLASSQPYNADVEQPRR